MLGTEVEAWDGGDDKWADDEEDDERRRDTEQRQQRAQAVAEQHRLAEGDAELVLQLRRVKKERPIVRRRPDVLSVGLVKRRGIVRSDQLRVFVRGGRVNPMRLRRRGARD